MPKDGRPEVAVIGRSNVGKSSLINALLGRRALARTSSAPGKTQTINFFAVNEAFYLVDLPGLGYAKASKKQRASWEALIGGYIVDRGPLSVVVHLVDARHPPTEIDLDVTSLVRETGVPYIVAQTKSDKLNQKARARSRRQVSDTIAELGLEPPIVETSAVKKTGIESLWQWIETLM
jgi:GTP-binding protein